MQSRKLKLICCSTKLKKPTKVCVRFTVCSDQILWFLILFYSTVLGDPHQRAIYDTVGLKGLKTNGWAIVPRTKTPQEIRDEFERLAR